MKSLLGFSVIVLIGLVQSLQAQNQVQVDDNIKVEIETEIQKTPEFQAGGVNNKKVPNPRDWLEIETSFELRTSPKDAVVPEIMVRYHVAIESEGGQTQVVSGDVVHQNVMGGEEIFSSAYVSPTTLGKITGDFRRFQESAVKSVAVEILYGGVLKGGASTQGSGRWWETLPNAGTVEPKHKTPFAMLWIDRYADVKE